MTKTYGQTEAAEIADALRTLVDRAERVGRELGDHAFINAAGDLKLVRSRLLDRAG